MTETATTTPVRARTQTAICLLTACALLGGFLLVDVSARNDTINDWLLERQLAKWTTTNSKFQYNRGYIDFEGRLIYGEVPAADYSDGGVYFFGSSIVKNSILFWELPPEQRRLIHNYALSGSGPHEWDQFLRYLIDHNHLLEAGGEKTTIIFGLYFIDFASSTFQLNEGLIRSMFTRHGLYDYSSDEIRPAAVSEPERLFLTEKARCANFLHYAFGHMAFRDKPPLSDRQKAQYYKIYADQPTPDYDERLKKFSDLVDYLRSKNVNVAAYFVPIGSWFRGGYGELPTASAFHEHAAALCREKQIPVLDINDLLTDEEFFDAGHANYAGQRKMHAPLIDHAVQQLQKSGVLPKPQTSTETPTATEPVQPKPEPANAAPG